MARLTSGAERERERENEIGLSAIFIVAYLPLDHFTDTSGLPIKITSRRVLKQTTVVIREITSAAYRD